MRSLLSRARLRFGRYGEHGEDKIRFWRDRLKSGYFAHTNTDIQIDKSKQIVAAVSRHCPGFTTLHEIGVGAGRNIHYLLEAFPDATYSGNDLDRSAIEPFMSDDVRRRLDLIEQDTASFLAARADEGDQFDVLLTSDHLIHIPPDTIDGILRDAPKCARRWIVLHEAVKRSPSRQDDFWWAHDYTALEREFAIVHEEPAVLGDEYVLRVYERRSSSGA